MIFVYSWPPFVAGPLSPQPNFLPSPSFHPKIHPMNRLDFHIFMLY